MSDLEQYHPFSEGFEYSEEHLIRLALYAIYFLGILCCSFFLDRSGLMDDIMCELAERGDQYHEKSLSNIQRRKDMIDDGKLKGNNDNKQMLPVMAVESRNPAKTELPRKTTSNRVSFITGFFGKEKRDLYRDEFWHDVMEGRSYLGTGRLESQKNRCCALFCCHSCCCQEDSYCGDFLFFFFNNHQILSCFGATPGHPFSRHDRRLCYLVQQTVGFCLATIAATLTLPDRNLSVPGMDLNITVNPSNQLVLINVLVISPVVLFLYKILYSILACPCLKVDCTSCILRCCKKSMERGGKTLGSLLCVIIGAAMLFYVSLYPADEFEKIYLYARQVHLASIVIDTLQCLIVFFPLFYLDVRVNILFMLRKRKNLVVDTTENIDLELAKKSKVKTFMVLNGVRVLTAGSWIGEKRDCRCLQFGTKPPREFECF